MRIAAIDLGSNSIRLEIREFSSAKKSKTIFKEKLVVRLGQDVFLTHKLHPAAKARTLKALIYFAGVIKRHGVTKVSAIGTSALRDAKDSKKFIALVKRETGIPLRKISGDEEANLIALAVLKNEKVRGNFSGLIDIGGGSTEVIAFHGKKLSAKNSFNVGSVRLHEHCLKSSPPRHSKSGPDPIFSARHYIRSLLKDATPHQIKLLYGTSDTSRILARIFNYSGEPNVVTLPLLAAFISEISTMKLKEIKSIKGMDPQRADIILAGAIILEEMMRFYGVEEVIPSRVSLRHGVFAKTVERIKF